MEKETDEQRPDGSEGRSSVTIWERALQREGAVGARNKARSVPNLLEEGLGQCGSVRESRRERGWRGDQGRRREKERLGQDMQGLSSQGEDIGSYSE